MSTVNEIETFFYVEKMIDEIVYPMISKINGKYWGKFDTKKKANNALKRAKKNVPEHKYRIIKYIIITEMNDWE